MEEAGFMTYTAGSHQVAAIKMMWVVYGSDITKFVGRNLVSLVLVSSFHCDHQTVFCPSLQDRQSERHKDSRINLRPPSQSATYATVSAWHHQPEKLILESCGYEATVSLVLLSFTFHYSQ